MEQPGKESKKPALRQRRNWYSIRIVMGAYLVYLSWQIGSAIFNGQAEKDSPVLLGIAAGVFLIVGVIFMIINIRSLRMDKTPDEDEAVSGKTEPLRQLGTDKIADEDETLPKEKPE